MERYLSFSAFLIKPLAILFFALFLNPPASNAVSLTGRPIDDQLDVDSNLIGTPLMWAMEAKQQKAVDLLLSLGAKPKSMPAG